MTLDEIRTRFEALGVQVGSTFLAKTGAGVLLAVQIGAEPEQWDALLGGPSLTTEETEALRWGIMQAQMHLARTANPGAAADYDNFAKGFASLFTRMGAIPSTPKTGEEDASGKDNGR